MSTRVTQTMTMRTLLTDIQSASRRVSAAQEKLSSGRQLNFPSDNPAGTSRALQFRSDLEATVQYQRNSIEATTWQDVTDTTLRQITDLTLRARELLVQGANGTLGPQGREALALEVDQLVDSVKSTANAQYAGRFILSGSATGTPPYALGASDAYAGNTAVVQREIGKNVRVDLNEIGVSVVGDTGGGLLQTLRTVAADLRANNMTALQNGDLQAIDVAHDTLLTARARVGARMNRLETATVRLQELEQNTIRLLSETEDADMAEAFVDFSMQQSVYQSALKSGAQLIQPSLIDFLR